MKARLSSTVWLLVFWVTLLLVATVGFSYYAGSHSAADAAMSREAAAVPPDSV